MTVTDAVNKLNELVVSNPPDYLFFAEQHQAETSQSSFREFFLQAVRSLRPLGYANIFVETNHYADSDFHRFIEGSISLAEYRVKWAKPGSKAALFKDQFFYSLRDLHYSGFTIAFINQVNDPGRDRFMSRKLRQLKPENQRAVFLCGYGHAAKRPGCEQGKWLSAAELSSTSPGNQVFSIAEVSRAMLLHYDHDARVPDLLNGLPAQISLSASLDMPEYREYVFSKQRIGRGTGQYTEFNAETVTVRFRHYDALFFDTNRFMAECEEPLGMSRPWS